MLLGRGWLKPFLSLVYGRIPSFLCHSCLAHGLGCRLMESRRMLIRAQIYKFYFISCNFFVKIYIFNFILWYGEEEAAKRQIASNALLSADSITCRDVKINLQYASVGRVGNGGRKHPRIVGWKMEKDGWFCKRGLSCSVFILARHRLAAVHGCLACFRKKSKAPVGWDVTIRWNGMVEVQNARLYFLRFRLDILTFWIDGG